MESKQFVMEQQRIEKLVSQAKTVEEERDKWKELANHNYNAFLKSEDTLRRQKIEMDRGANQQKKQFREILQTLLDSHENLINLKRQIQSHLDEV